jgi:hypothetical protein
MRFRSIYQGTKSGDDTLFIIERKLPITALDKSAYSSQEGRVVSETNPRWGSDVINENLLHRFPKAECPKDMSHPGAKLPSCD